MSTTLTIGRWIERESRDVRQCPSYYAADTETLRTKVGEYPLRLTFEGGYTVPMPYWLLTKIDADRIDGRLYSGFGGNNFASTELPHEAAPLRIQMQAYSLPELIAAGRVELFPEYAALGGEHAEQIEWARERGWKGIGELAA